MRFSPEPEKTPTESPAADDAPPAPSEDVAPADATPASNEDANSTNGRNARSFSPTLPGTPSIIRVRPSTLQLYASRFRMDGDGQMSHPVTGPMRPLADVIAGAHPNGSSSAPLHPPGLPHPPRNAPGLVRMGFLHRHQRTQTAADSASNSGYPPGISLEVRARTPPLPRQSMLSGPRLSIQLPQPDPNRSRLRAPRPDEMEMPPHRRGMRAVYQVVVAGPEVGIITTHVPIGGEPGDRPIFDTWEQVFNFYEWHYNQGLVCLYRLPRVNPPPNRVASGFTSIDPAFLNPTGSRNNPIVYNSSPIAPEAGPSNVTAPARHQRRFVSTSPPKRNKKTAKKSAAKTKYMKGKKKGKVTSQWTPEVIDRRLSDDDSGSESPVEATTPIRIRSRSPAQTTTPIRMRSEPPAQTTTPIRVPSPVTPSRWMPGMPWPPDDMYDWGSPPHRTAQPLPAPVAIAPAPVNAPGLQAPVAAASTSRVRPPWANGVAIEISSDEEVVLDTPPPQRPRRGTRRYRPLIRDTPDPSPTATLASRAVRSAAAHASSSPHTGRTILGLSSPFRLSPEQHSTSSSSRATRGLPSPGSATQSASPAVNRILFPDEDMAGENAGGDDE